jgi:hypothetical protein
LLTACGKEYTTLPTSPTITQGIYGTVVERWGDWQPHPGSTVSAGETPIRPTKTIPTPTQLLPW